MHVPGVWSRSYLTRRPLQELAGRSEHTGTTSDTGYGKNSTGPGRFREQSRLRNLFRYPLNRLDDKVHLVEILRLEGFGGNRDLEFLLQTSDQPQDGQRVQQAGCHQPLPFLNGPASYLGCSFTRGVANRAPIEPQCSYPRLDFRKSFPNEPFPRFPPRNLSRRALYDPPLWHDSHVAGSSADCREYNLAYCSFQVDP